MHDAASSLAEEASVTAVIADCGAAGTAPGDDLVPKHTSDAPSMQGEDASVFTGGRADVSPQMGDASVPTQFDQAADMHPGELVSAVASADAQADSPAFDASMMENMPQEWWRLIGSAAESIPEHQLHCIVQGMRLLVTLLRDNHTWNPVWLPIQHICLLDAETRQTRHLLHRICITCEKGLLLSCPSLLESLCAST